MRPSLGPRGDDLNFFSNRAPGRNEPLCPRRSIDAALITRTLSLRLMNFLDDCVRGSMKEQHARSPTGCQKSTADGRALCEVELNFPRFSGFEINAIPRIYFFQPPVLIRDTYIHYEIQRTASGLARDPSNLIFSPKSAEFDLESADRVFELARVDAGPVVSSQTNLACPSPSDSE